jgi:hypothetical protein
MVRPAGTTAVNQAGQRPGIEHSTTTITPSGAAGAPVRSTAAAKSVAQTTNDPLEIARRARLDSLSNALDSALKEQPLNHRLVQHIAQSLQHEADVLKQEVQELGDQLRASAGKRPHSTSFASAAHPPGARPDVLSGARDSRGGSDVAGGSSDAGDYSESDLYKDISGEEARRDASALRDSIERMRREGRPRSRPDVDSGAQGGGGTAVADSSAHISPHDADATRRVLRDWPQTDSRDLRGDDPSRIFSAMIAHLRRCGA